MPGPDGEQQGPGPAETGQQPQTVEIQGKVDIGPVMLETIKKLKDKNKEFDGALCKVVGYRPDEQSLMFPNPVRREVPTDEGPKAVDRFVSVTPKGFRVIEMDASYGDQMSNRDVTNRDLVSYLMSNKHTLPSTDIHSGWRGDNVQIGQDLAVNTQDGRVGMEVAGDRNPGIRVLEDFPPEDAVEVIRARIDDVQTKRDEERRAQDEQNRKAQVQINAATEIGKLLG
jgi:hypothetical protein